MNNHYTKIYYTEDRLVLFNYFYNSPQLFLSKLKKGDDIKSLDINNIIHKASVALVTFTKFIWNELFTSWDRLLYEFTYKKSFSSKEFSIICRDNINFLSKYNKNTYNNLLLLKSNGTIEDLYIYLIDYIIKLYKGFNKEIVSLSI